MASAGGDREKEDRLAGWTSGPGVTLVDSVVWYLPSIDDGLIPCLGTLFPLVAEVVYLGRKRYRKEATDEEYLLALNRYLIEALAVQYRTSRAVFVSLTSTSLLLAAILKNPDAGDVATNHLIELWKFAVRRRLVRSDGTPDLDSTN